MPTVVRSSAAAVKKRWEDDQHCDLVGHSSKSTESNRLGVKGEITESCIYLFLPPFSQELEPEEVVSSHVVVVCIARDVLLDLLRVDLERRQRRHDLRNLHCVQLFLFRLRAAADQAGCKL